MERRLLKNLERSAGTFPKNASVFVVVISVVMFGLCCLHLATGLFTNAKHFHKNKENAEKGFYWEVLLIRFQLLFIVVPLLLL